MSKQAIIKYMVKEGFNEKLLTELTNKELFRMFVICLAINSNHILY